MEPIAETNTFTSVKDVPASTTSPAAPSTAEKVTRFVHLTPDEGHKSSKETMEAYKRHDSTKGESWTKKEVQGLARDLNKEKRDKGFFRSLVVFLGCSMLLLVAAVFAVSFAAGEAIKEAHVKGSLMTDLSGQAVATSTVSFQTDLFALPYLSPVALTKLERVDVVVDGRSGGQDFDSTVVTASFHIASISKHYLLDEVTISTVDGAKIRLNGAAKNGTIVIPCTSAQCLLPNTGANTYAVYERVVDIEGFAPSRRQLQSSTESYKAGCALTQCPFPLKPSCPGNGQVCTCSAGSGPVKSPCRNKYDKIKPGMCSVYASQNDRAGVNNCESKQILGGYGHVRQWMAEYCPCACANRDTSVTQPEVKCSNTYPDTAKCTGWASRGYCDKSILTLDDGELYPDWMKKNCALACNACS